MSYKLNIEEWHRKDHFKFFSQFEEPFFGVTVPIDCSEAYNIAKSAGLSFFLFYLYKSLVAANATEPFKYRIAGDEIIVYDKVNASPTINRPNGTFGFAYIDFFEDQETFFKEAQKEINRVQKASGLVPSVSGENVIHYSSLPWLNFTSLTHARAFSFKDSIPKISFGKMTEENGQRKMPLSVHVHHGLMDGYEVGQFVNLFQDLMNES